MTFGRFFLPGPTEVLPDALAAMTRPMMAHRSRECAELFASLQPGLQALFGTRDTVLVAAGSATAMMEAGIRLLPPGRVLALVNGAFSERYAAIAEACGHEVDRVEVAWGETHDPAAVAARLDGHVGVTVVHNETSTGALQPVGEIAAAAAGTPVLADSVSGVGGAPVAFDDWGLAWIAAGSQKALAVPPGLAFGVAADAFLKGGGDRAPGAGFYLDAARYAERQPPFTPALPQIYALAVQLDRIAEEGLPARFARHAAMADRCRAWAATKGLAVLARPGRQSPTVTCIAAPDGWTGPEFVAALLTSGYTVGGGYGKLRDGWFRIGHMGEQTEETLDGLLAACDEVLAQGKS